MTPISVDEDTSLPLATRISQALLLGYLLVSFGLFVTYCTTIIAYPFEICAGEGILLNQGRLLAHGQAIYRPVGDYPFLISHFPPVLPLLLALGVKLFGIAFWPGRLLTFLSSIAVGVAIYRVADDDGERWPALGGALLFAASPWIALSSVELCVDMVAAALSLWGLCLVARGRGRMRQVLAASLFALAALTRQTQIAGAVASCWWLWGRDRKACWRVGVTWLVLVALGAAATEALSAGQFHKHVVTYTAGTLSLSRLWLFTCAYVRLHAAMLALGLWGCWQSRGCGRSGLTWRYLVVCYALASTCARQGSGQTYFIEAIAATCIAASCGLSALWSAGRRPWVAACASLVLIGLLCEVRLGSETPRPPTPVERAETGQLLDKLKRLGPPMLSEYNGLVLQAGGELLFQPYALRMLASQGLWDDSVLVADIERQRFTAVVVDRVDRGRWTRHAYAALSANYGVEGEYRLYRHIGEARVQLLVRLRSAPGLRPCPAIR